MSRQVPIRPEAWETLRRAARAASMSQKRSFTASYRAVCYEGGRVLETDPAGTIVWEYVSRYSQKDIAEITDARLYSPGYFNVKDWACNYAGT